MEKQLVTGFKPEPDKMQPVVNEYFVKAHGGLWSSTFIDGSSGWVEWCEREDFNNTEQEGYLLTVNPSARIYTVDCYADLVFLHENYPLILSDIPSAKFLDFEAIAKDYDAVHLTTNGMFKTHLSFPYRLYGWDCESTHWFRWVFDKVEHAGTFFKDREVV